MNESEVVIVCLLIILAIVSTVMACMLANAEGAEYKFNMTQEQKQEWNLVPVCGNINQSGIYIEGLNQTCWQIYGGPVI